VYVPVEPSVFVLALVSVAVPTFGSCGNAALYVSAIVFSYPLSA
jgi:hypothetical protein